MTVYRRFSIRVARDLTCSPPSAQVGILRRDFRSASHRMVEFARRYRGQFPEVLRRSPPCYG
jgi:hypothetical protein